MNKNSETFARHIKSCAINYACVSAHKHRVNGATWTGVPDAKFQQKSFHHIIQLLSALYVFCFMCVGFVLVHDIRLHELITVNCLESLKLRGT